MSPARRKPAKRAGRVPKTARLRSAAKKSASRKAARKAATRKAVKKAARAPVRGAGSKRTTRPRAKLAVVRPVRVVKAAVARPAKPPEPQAFAEAKAGASPKDLVLFELVRARVAVAAAVQGMSASAADLPTAEGKWSARETILHLAYWDREMIPALEDAYQHSRWPNITHEDVLRQNPAGVDELRHHDWESAKRLFQLHRERLMEEFQSIPEEPAETWTKEHPVGRLARMLTHHDRHHADNLKASRTRGQ